MWKGQASRLAFRPEDGIEVIATGRVTTFPGRSKYQLVVDSLVVEGEGALMRLFEKVKARLGGEGLFDREHKQTRPYLPGTTSPEARRVGEGCVSSCKCRGRRLM